MAGGIDSLLGPPDHMAASPVARGRIAQAPGTFNDSLVVTLVNYSRDAGYEVPATQWTSEVLPAAGDEVAVVIDDEGDAWVVGCSVDLVNVDKMVNYLLQRETDELTVTMVNGLRRSQRVERPVSPEVRYIGLDEQYEGQDQNVDGERPNTTAAGMAIDVVARHTVGRSEFLDELEEMAEVLLGFQWGDPATLRYGGFKLTDADTRASAFGTGVAGMGLLSTFGAINKPKYFAAAVRAADFLVRLADPNAYWFPKYGVNPINRTANGVTWHGFCDRVNGFDGLSTTCSTWNLVAAQFLLRMYQATGNMAYLTVAMEARDFMAGGVIGGYDLFAVSCNPDATYAFAEWPNDPSAAWNDHRFHRLGDVVETGTVGTDPIEYGLAALLELGYDRNVLLSTYLKYRNMPYMAPLGSFETAYHERDLGGICWPGFFRMGNAVNAPGPDRKYGSYLDSQGAGTTLPVKRALAPADYRRTVEFIINRITEHGALLTEDGYTKWSSDPPVWYGTKGTIPVAAAALGVLV